MGDLNAYAAEDPITVLEQAGLAGQTGRFVRPAERYSYVFDGQSGELDHVLAGRDLARRITGAAIWHINSDEPLILDYNTEYNPPGLYRPDAYRSSDHDPLLVGLRLR
jgi:predicted extracellular nuclease